MVDCASVRLVSMIGVKNFEGILGADTFRRPGLTAAALILGEFCPVGALMIGPDTLFFLSKTELDASYLPGPITALWLVSRGFGFARFK